MRKYLCSIMPCVQHVLYTYITYKIQREKKLKCPLYYTYLRRFMTNKLSECVSKFVWHYQWWTLPQTLPQMTNSAICPSLKITLLLNNCICRWLWTDKDWARFVRDSYTAQNGQLGTDFKMKVCCILEHDLTVFKFAISI